MMLRIFILKASGRKEACGKLVRNCEAARQRSVGDPAFCFPDSTPLARLKQQGNHRKEERREEKGQITVKPPSIWPLTKR